MKKNRLMNLKNFTQYLFAFLLIINVQFGFAQKKVVNQKMNSNKKELKTNSIRTNSKDKRFQNNTVINENYKTDNKENLVKKTDGGVKAASWNYSTNTGNVGTTYSWIDCSGGTSLSLGDDAEDSFNWPFSFIFYDDSYTTSNSLSVCSNGFIRLDGTATTSYSSASSYTLGSTSTELGQIIALGVQDCNVGGGSSWVRYLVTGSSPNRILTVEYNNLEIDYDDGNFADLQVSFYETSNVVVIKFGTDNVTKTLADIGIHSGTDNYFHDWQDVDNGTNNRWIEYTPPPVCASPTDQPTALSLTPYYTSIDGTFTAAASSPDGYLVVISTNSSLSANPVDGTTYSAGDALGGGTVVQSGAGTSFSATGLSSGTQYYFYIFSQNYSCTGGPTYLTTSPLIGNATTLDCTVAAFPYLEDFDGVTTPALPTCWVIEDNSAPNDDWITSSTSSNSSPNSMYIEYDGSNALDDWAFTPPLTLTGGVTYKVRFKYRARSASYPENLEVDWGTSNSSAAMSGTVIFDDNGFVNDTYVEGTGLFTPGSNGTYYVGWHAYSAADQFGIYVDDIEIFIPNDQTSKVDAPTSAQIAASDVSSLKNSSTNAVDVFKFDIDDLGSGDLVSTQVTTFNIHKNSGTADWTDNIGGAELWNGGSKIPNLDVTITDTDITFTKSTGTFDVSDGTSEEITLKIWLNSSNIVDNSTMVFEVLQTGHGFVANPSGSEFDSDFGTATVSNTQTIRVVATQLMFTGQPTNTATSGVALSTQPIVSATDASGNVDVDITSNVTLSNSGGLTMSNNSMNFVAGVADFGTPNNFMFTTGGKYVMLSASDGTLNSISPSNEIAVDIIGCTLWTEDFDAVPIDNDLTGAGGWAYVETTSSTNDWGIQNRTGNGRCLTIYNGNTAFQYNKSNDGEEVAFYDTPIDATNFKNVSITMDWQCRGEVDNDYGNIMWSTDGVNWFIANGVNFVSQNTWTTGTYEISVVDGQQFYIGFRWKNNGSSGSNPPFAVDNIVIRGFPKFDYNFSYRQDDFEQITGTVVTLDGQDGVNISLPTGYDFSYDGVAVASIRANENGWLEMGTSQTGSPLVTNDLSDIANVPILAPFWDDLTSDAQTRIIYLVEGTAPVRIFTVEWKDILWGGQRQNFQVKLYETSNVIEFWYGDMNTNNSGSASIGINNTGGCLNKIISVIPGVTPSVSYTAENNTINSTTYLNSGLVYIFNPLHMQSYSSWEEATVSIGQTDFTQRDVDWHQWTTPGANNTAVSSKGVLAVGAQQDPGPWDNTWGWIAPKDVGRVLIWNSIPTSDGQNADAVIGKTSFTDETTGCTDVLMTDVEGVTFTPDGNKLIASDGNSNRVLIWNTIPTGAGQAADVVIGQPNFTSNGAGCSATQMEYPTDVFVTPDGKLFICDYVNNRVLVYNSVPVTNNVAADVVIGQPDFTTNSAGTSATKLNGPWGVSYSPDAKLFIADVVNNRILIYNDVPTSNGAAADVVIGQNNLTSNSSGSSRSKMFAPIGVTVSPEGKVALGDFQNSRALIFNRIPTVNGASADVVLGQSNFTDNYCYSDGFTQQDNAYSNPYLPTNRNMFTVYGVNFDLNGRLLTSAKYMERAMLYGVTPTQIADLELHIVADEVNVCVYSDVEYTVQVTNNGPDPASSVVVNAQLPVDINATTYDASVGTYNQKSGYWMIPYIAVGETVTLTFKGEVQPGLAGTNVTAYANIIASKQRDSDFSNNGASQVVAVQTYYAPTSTDIADQYINRNSHTIPVISFTVDDQDAGDLAGVTYSNSSSNTTLIPLNYTTNLVYAGTAPNKTLDITPALNEYGYSDMELILTDTHGCHKNYDFKISVGNIWEGNGNSMIAGQETKWDESNNWSSRNVPTSIIEAIIPTTPIGGYFPIIDVVGAECLDLIIEPKASLILNNTFSLHVNGDMSIQSDITGTGSFVDYNSGNGIRIDGDIYVQRYVSSDAWHYVSTPLTGVTNKVLTENVCGANYNGNVLDYNEAYVGSNWLDGWEWSFASPNNDPLLTTNGYAYFNVAGQCTNMIEFTGASVTLNSGDYTYSVTNQDENWKPTGTNPHRGWNLVGNPYPSGLNADDFMSTNIGVIDGTVYFWDEVGSTGFDSEGADYAAYNTSGGGVTGTGSGAVVPDQYISCGQAFYVHRTHTDIAGSNVSFTNAMREAENSFFFKKKEKVNPEVPKIKMSVLNSQNMYNEIVVMLVDDATEEVNPKYDGYKPEGNPNLSFYSIKNGSGFIFQGILPVTTNQIKSVPLGINAGIAGKYTFAANLIEYIPDSIGVYLEDTYLNEIVNLRKQKSYSVTINETGRYNDRFVLHFNINHVPYLVTEIPDKTINCEEFSSFNILANSFADEDDDNLTYSVSLVSGAKLPNWLNFNTTSLTFSGTPSNSDASVYRIRVQAEDNYGAIAYDDFNLTVLSTVGVAGVEQSTVNVYPNPTSGMLYISTNVQNGFRYQITDVTGKTIIETNSNSINEQVDISKLTSGIYFVKVIVGDKTSDFKVFLQK